MENELDIIESLTSVGYKGPCLRNDNLTEALNGGVKSELFREIVGWLTYELHVLRKTDEKVDKESEISEFSMELSAMLKELGCPYKRFVAGPLSSRFQSKQLRIQLLEYLITELMTAKMCFKQKPVSDDSYVIPKFETNTARALQMLSEDLDVGKPPDNIAPKALFDKINYKLEDAKRRTNKLLVGDSLLNSNKQMNEQQWKKLEAIHKSLEDEYNLRRQVLLTRLEVTVQSFQWAEKMKGREALISNKYEEKMKELDKLRVGGMEADIIALLAARSDLAIIEKTSSANVRKNTGSRIQKHVIGSVPDRGGRANEHAPPPPEMPSWQTQRSSGGGGRGGGGGGGFRGSRGGARGGSAGGGGRGGGGGGGGSGGGGGGGGNWQQPQQGGQNNGGRGGNFQQQNQGGNNNAGRGGNFQSQNQGDNWLSGSGRVQGAGWNPSQQNNYNNDNQMRRGSFAGRGDSNNQYEDQYQNNRNRGGGNSNYNRGRSNYNRGGGGGGGGGGYRNN